jgi:tRNA modification GTPase
LLERERAIVTAIPGTTRDTVSEAFDLEGIPVRLVDTAGVRQSTDVVEALGIERTWKAMADADVTLVVFDGCQPLQQEDHDLWKAAQEQGHCLAVVNKCDLPDQANAQMPAVRVSALTGQGISDLRRAIIELLAPGSGQCVEGEVITTARHELLLSESLEAIQNAERATQFGLPHEMLLLDCYAALRPFDALTGATTADDILNHIFSTFCIGK